MQHLVHVDSPFINFRDFEFPEAGSHAFRWVHLKRFRLPAEALTDRELLAALIAHPEFRDTYDGYGVWTEPRHGQWWSDRIGPTTYLPVDEESAVERIRVWADGGSGVLAELDRRLEEEVYAGIRKATSRYVLGPLPEEAFHDYGPIHIEFHELVLIDRQAGLLVILVAADD